MNWLLSIGIAMVIFWLLWRWIDRKMQADFERRFYPYSHKAPKRWYD